MQFCILLTKEIKSMKNKHSFHIPVMGIGFSVDSALKVAHLGIDSVMSLSGHGLHEKLRKLHCEKHGIKYEEISKEVSAFKAKRTTAYLNLVNKLVKQKHEAYKNSTLENKVEIEKYISLLPNNLILKKEFSNLLKEPINKDNCKLWVESNLRIGSIDVNIMTKLDRENYIKGEKLPPEHNDAHVALRGYANSDVSSSLILSAGLNPRLFTYMEQFDDFFPDKNGKIKKKIVLKVSDYRSALIQGRFLAKKGLWVSEYRIESGLNCGGHAFATDGFLMGPILAEFKNNRSELVDSVFDVFKTAMDNKNYSIAKELLPFSLTAQGGVGTAEEHQFLLEEYQLDSIGWGSPFLLVPEVTAVDKPTINRLIEATEDDFYLSKISPLGVPFNSLRNTSKDIERKQKIEKGKPGSPCIEGNLALFNKEFTDTPICTASRQYQKLKIASLKDESLEPNVYKKKYNEIVEKTCLCTGLVNSVLIMGGLKVPTGNEGVAICPGPNMLYFKKVMSLKEIVNHIYGKKSITFSLNRPHMFIKELDAYIKYLANSIEDLNESVTKKEHRRLVKFTDNLLEGINYYYTTFKEKKNAFKNIKDSDFNALDMGKEKVNKLQEKILVLTLI